MRVSCCNRFTKKFQRRAQAPVQVERSAQINKKLITFISTYISYVLDKVVMYQSC